MAPEGLNPPAPGDGLLATGASGRGDETLYGNAAETGNRKQEAVSLKGPVCTRLLQPINKFTIFITIITGR